MQSIYSMLREKYRPARVVVLFIGESPPLPKDPSMVPYFYNEKEDRPRGLYRRIASALGLKEPKAEGLEDFKRRNMWLTDIFDEPVNNVKTEEIGKHLDRLMREIKEANPRKIIALFPKKARNQMLLYFLRRYVSPNIEVFHINPWTESQEKLKNSLSEFLKESQRNERLLTKRHES